MLKSHCVHALTDVNLVPSLFHVRAVIVYRLGIVLGGASSHISLRGDQLYTLNLKQNIDYNVSQHTREKHPI